MWCVGFRFYSRKEEWNHESTRMATNRTRLAL